jgi:outer membrane usher protein FimD/PapC
MGFSPVERLISIKFQYHSRPKKIKVRSIGNTRKGNTKRLRLIIFAMLLLSLAVVSWADETIIVSVNLNQRPQGDLFVQATTDRDFLLRLVDLKAMGLKEVPGRRVEYEGEVHVSLKSMRGVRFTFHENTLTLDLEVPPSLLPVTLIDYMPERHQKVRYTGDENSAFVNYRLNYIGAESLEFQTMELTTEVGLRTRDLLFTTDSTYTRNPGHDRFVRLGSSITFDNRREMRRWVFGDFFASSGELASSLNMGGISLTKVYRIDPYFIRQPMFNTTGLISTPSDVEVYLDGMLIKKERLSPGGFELRNISSYNGASDIELLIRDAFGHVERISYPFYFTNTVLSRGLHEYSYNLGLLREEFGTRSNQYGGGAISAFHRLGVTDNLTVGFEAEAAAHVNTFGAAASYLNNRTGVTNMAALLSSERDSGGGYAGLINHTYQGRRLGARLLFKGFSRNFATVNENLSTDRVRFEAGAGASYGTAEMGTASVDYTTVEKHAGDIRKTFTTTYSRTITRRASIYATYKNIVDNGVVNNELFVVLTLNPWKEAFASANWKIDRDSNKEELQMTRNAPFGEGYGWRATYSRTDEGGETTNVLNPYLQYNGRYGIYTAEYRSLESSSTSNEGYELSAAGGLAYVGGAWGASRPVTDSFGVVRVGGLKDVRVFNNNQEVGRTNARGEVFVSELSSYYDNQISIDASSIPIDYSIDGVEKIISPALRSGSIVVFEADRIRALTGRIKIRIGRKTVSAEFYKVALDVDGDGVTFPTGRDGEFYLENLRPGSYRGSIMSDTGTCSFNLEVPDNDDAITDLGEVICEQTI